MKTFGYLILIIFSVLLQIAWGPWLSFLGFAIPLSLLVLLIGIKWFKSSSLLIFAFFSGLFYDLVSSETLGIMALVQIVVVGGAMMIFKKRGLS